MFRRLLLLLVAVIPMLLTASPANAYTPSDAERYAQRDANNTRLNNGRHSLRMHTTLSYCAHRHAANMAARRKLYHSSCANVRENVGYASSMHRVLQLFMKSYGHRVNLLCRCTRIAVGVVRSRGLYWMTEMYL